MVVIITGRQRGTEGTLVLQMELSEGHCKTFIFLAFLKGISFILKWGIFSLSLFWIFAYIAPFVLQHITETNPSPVDLQQPNTVSKLVSIDFEKSTTTAGGLNMLLGFFFLLGATKMRELFVLKRVILLMGVI